MPTCGDRVQYNHGTGSGRHLNKQRTSLLTLTPLWLEGESDGAKSRRGKRNMAPVSLQEEAVSAFSQNTLGPTQWPLVLLLIYCKEQNLLQLPRCHFRLPLVSFHAEPLEAWELRPINDCTGVPCQQERQKVPHAPSLALLHAGGGIVLYHTEPDLLRLRKAWSQSSSCSRHVFHPLVSLHGEMAGRGR